MDTSEKEKGDATIRKKGIQRGQEKKGVILKTLKTLEKNTLREDRQMSRRTKGKGKILPNLKILGKNSRKRNRDNRDTTFSNNAPLKAWTWLRTPAVEWRQLKSLSPKLISQKENRDKDRPNDHLPPSKKRPSHASQERERDTSLGSRLEGKGSKEGRKNTPPKLNREKRKKDLNSSPNGDEPESRPKTERMGAGQERSHL